MDSKSFENRHLALVHIFILYHDGFLCIPESGVGAVGNTKRTYMHKVWHGRRGAVSGWGMMPGNRVMIEAKRNIEGVSLSYEKTCRKRVPFVGCYHSEVFRHGNHH